MRAGRERAHQLWPRRVNICSYLAGATQKSLFSGTAGRAAPVAPARLLRAPPRAGRPRAHKVRRAGRPLLRTRALPVAKQVRRGRPALINHPAGWPDGGSRLRARQVLRNARAHYGRARIRFAGRRKSARACGHLLVGQHAQSAGRSAPSGRRRGSFLAGAKLALKCNGKSIIRPGRARNRERRQTGVGATCNSTRSSSARPRSL